VRWRDVFKRSPRIIRYAFVGGLGFCIDTGVLYFALDALRTGYYGGRILSYTVAATSTWYLHRRFTFADTRNDNRIGEWGRFVVLNLIGGAVNYAIYVAYVSTHKGSAAAPAIGVALGSFVVMFFSFFLSRWLVFNRRPEADLTELR
jgi:putative flippase GtrA